MLNVAYFDHGRMAHGLPDSHDDNRTMVTMLHINMKKYYEIKNIVMFFQHRFFLRLWRSGFPSQFSSADAATSASASVTIVCSNVHRNERLHVTSATHIVPSATSV